jgi:hypothetical protein
MRSTIGQEWKLPAVTKIVLQAIRLQLDSSIFARTLPSQR